MPRAGDTVRSTRRLRAYLTAAAGFYLLGAIFGAKFHVLMAAVLVALAARDYLRTRPSLTGVEVRCAHPTLWPAGVPLPITLTVLTDHPIDVLEVSLDLVHEPEGRWPGAVFDALEPGREVEAAFEVAAFDRGTYAHTQLRLATGGEMGLVWREEIRPLAGSVDVYPAESPPERTLSPPMEPLELTTGIIPGPLAPSGLSFVRPLGRGDSLRRIHWRATARLGEIVVLSTRLGPPARVLILVDTGCQEGRAGALETVLEVGSWALVQRWDGRRRILALTNERPDDLTFDEDDPIVWGRRRLARARPGGSGDLATFLARLPRALPECEVVVVRATPPHLPAVEGYPMGFLVGAALRGAPTRARAAHGRPR